MHLLTQKLTSGATQTHRAVQSQKMASGLKFRINEVEVTADQLLCFRFIDSMMPLLSKSEVSIL